MPLAEHLQMVQDVITRLAGQSMTVKGWSITITGALLGYSATTSTPLVAVIAALAVIAFAALDGYYLAIERAYRDLYRATIAGTVPDWDMTVPAPSTREYLAAVLARPHLLLYTTSLIATIAVFSYLTTR